MKWLRIGLIILGLAAIAAYFAPRIQGLETLRKSGQVILLDLRPADPRALMMGDYMALAYRDERPVAISSEDMKALPNEGAFVLKLDDKNVASFVRVDDESTLAEDEIRLKYIKQRWGVSFGAPRYYFQNGTAETYEPARYGKFRVSPSGYAILTGLVDEDFNDILPPED